MVGSSWHELTRYWAEHGEKKFRALSPDCLAEVACVILSEEMEQQHLYMVISLLNWWEFLGVEPNTGKANVSFKNSKDGTTIFFVDDQADGYAIISDWDGFDVVTVWFVCSDTTVTGNIGCTFLVPVLTLGYSNGFRCEIVAQPCCASCTLWTTVDGWTVCRHGCVMGIGRSHFGIYYDTQVASCVPLMTMVQVLEHVTLLYHRNVWLVPKIIMNFAQRIAPPSRHFTLQTTRLHQEHHHAVSIARCISHLKTLKLYLSWFYIQTIKSSWINLEVMLTRGRQPMTIIRK